MPLFESLVTMRYFPCSDKGQQWWDKTGILCLVQSLLLLMRHVFNLPLSSPKEESRLAAVQEILVGFRKSILLFNSVGMGEGPVKEAFIQYHEADACCAHFVRGVKPPIGIVKVRI